LEVAGFVEHPARARVLAEAGWAAARRGDISLAVERLERSVEAQRAGARFAAAAFTYLLTLSSRSQVAHEARLEMITEGLALAEASGDRVAENGLRSAYASTLALVSSDMALAQKHAKRALDDARALRQPTLEIAALYTLAQTTFRTDPAEAIALVRASVDMGRQYHNEAEEGAALGLLAYLEARHGDARQGVLALRDKTVWEIHNGGITAAPYFIGAGAFSRIDRHDLVALCEGNTRKSIGGGVTYLLWEDLHEEEVETARAALGNEEFEALVARGAAFEPADFSSMLLHEIDATLEELGDS
jgi:hypothetical protein